MTSPRLALALIATAQFVLVLDITIVTIALPTIQRELGFEEAELQWLVTAYALTFGGFLLLAGRAADLFGRRRMFVVGILAFGAASLTAGLAVNELMGYQHRLLLEFTGGYGFVGIAVALMGRAHPVGIILASLLFGILYQGGAELAFEQPNITRDMVVVIGGIIILFAGALDGLFRRIVVRLLPRVGFARA